jgi:hypothetical protein
MPSNVFFTKNIFTAFFDQTKKVALKEVVLLAICYNL